MHRLIMKAQDGIQVDHRSHDGLDNTHCNLRLATNKQNTQNSRLSKNNTSGYKGVSRFRSKWQAGIKVNYRRIHIGHFDTAEEAALAYNDAAQKHFGEFAVLNNIP